MTDAEWAVVEAALPVPAWLAGNGGRPEKHCYLVFPVAGGFVGAALSWPGATDKGLALGLAPLAWFGGESRNMPVPSRTFEAGVCEMARDVPGVVIAGKPTELHGDAALWFVLGVIVLGLASILIALDVRSIADRFPWRGRDDDPERHRRLVAFNRVAAGIFGVALLVSALASAMR